ncbi:Uncharacterised protein g2829 [Pycnogonum litorale]
MNNAQELLYLKREEIELRKVLDELRKQQTKLQIEELTLKSAIREQNIKSASQKKTSINSESQNSVKANDSSGLKSLNLNVTETLEALADGGCFEEEDEDSSDIEDY